MKKFNNKAFSLIELSIVIIIIGILIAGVVRGSAIILKAKLNTAKSLTQSSPVAATAGLRLWLETTLDESISALQAVDETNVTVWYDINPQVSNKLFARNDNSIIQYRFDTGINSLPSLYFPGGTGAASTSFFTLSTSSASTNPTAIATGNNAFTVFLVAKADAVGTGVVNNAFYNGTAGDGGDGWGYLNSESNKALSFGATTAVDMSGGVAFSRGEVISIVSTGSAVTLYTDGVKDATIDASAVTIGSATDGFYIGSFDATGSDTDNWVGYISEIIIFDKKLSDANRKDIEIYLGTKYNIAITNS